MFTGLIRHQGRLRSRASGRLAVDCATLLPALALGDSVAVNGACLTVAQVDHAGFYADLLAATLRDTTLGVLPGGAALNLEPALRAGEALGGHFVQGHVDGVVKLATRKTLPGGDWLLEFELPGWLAPLVIEKGSIAIDGISLTLQELGVHSFSVAVIPATWRETNIGTIAPGGVVNIEADMIVKAVRRSVERGAQHAPELSATALRELGYGG